MHKKRVTPTAIGIMGIDILTQRIYCGSSCLGAILLGLISIVILVVSIDVFNIARGDTRRIAFRLFRSWSRRLDRVFLRDVLLTWIALQMGFSGIFLFAVGMWFLYPAPNLVSVFHMAYDVVFTLGSGIYCLIIAVNAWLIALRGRAYHPFLFNSKHKYTIGNRYSIWVVTSFAVVGSMLLYLGIGGLLRQ